MSIFRATTQTIIAPTALTTSYVNSQPINVEGYSDMIVEITYLTGAAETNNSVNLQILTSNDLNTDLYYMTTAAESTGTVTLTPATWVFTGASAATTYKFAFPVSLEDKFLVFSVKEDGVASNAGTLTLKIVLVDKFH